MVLVEHSQLWFAVQKVICFPLPRMFSFFCGRPSCSTVPPTDQRSVNNKQVRLTRRRLWYLKTWLDREQLWFGCFWITRWKKLWLAVWKRFSALDIGCILSHTWQRLHRSLNVLAVLCIVAKNCLLHWSNYLYLLCFNVVINMLVYFAWIIF